MRLTDEINCQDCHPEILDEIWFTEAMSQSHHFWLQFCIHTALSTEVAAIVSQRDLTAMHILLPFVLLVHTIRFNIRLLHHTIT